MNILEQKIKKLLVIKIILENRSNNFYFENFQKRYKKLTTIHVLIQLHRNLEKLQQTMYKDICFANIVRNKLRQINFDQRIENEEFV